MNIIFFEYTKLIRKKNLSYIDGCDIHNLMSKPGLLQERSYQIELFFLDSSKLLHTLGF